jgi:hypothetical protein
MSERGRRHSTGSGSSQDREYDKIIGDELRRKMRYGTVVYGCGMVAWHSIALAPGRLRPTLRTHAIRQVQLVVLLVLFLLELVVKAVHAGSQLVDLLCLAQLRVSDRAV